MSHLQLYAYRRKYMTDANSYFDFARESYRLHYIAATNKGYPRSVERMEFVVNEMIKERMLRS